MKDLKKYIAKQIIILGLCALISWVLLDTLTSVLATHIAGDVPNVGFLNESYVNQKESNGPVTSNIGNIILYFEKSGGVYIILLVAQILIQISIIVFLMKNCIRKIGIRIEEENHRLLQEKNELFANITHDLKTPITTLTGYTQMLVDGMVDNKEKEKEYLEAIHTKAIRMNQLIDVLFSYTKLESECYKLYITEVDFAELVRKNIAMMYSDFEDVGIELILEIPDEKMICQLDYLEMSRAVTNLLSNEIKHNKKNTVVTVRMESGVKTTLWIGDNGEEIPDNIMNTLFEPFVSGDESRSTHGGSGLGLAIAKKIVCLHGGTLKIEPYLDSCTKAFVIEV